MAHFAGLVAAGLHPSPVPHCDFVTSTTHKTLAGPRAGFVLCRAEHAQALDRAVFPGMQGGPLNHTIAAKATCFAVAASEAFRDYQRQVRANAGTLSSALGAGGLDILTGGTDTHLLLVDLRRTDWTGRTRRSGWPRSRSPSTATRSPSTSVHRPWRQACASARRRRRCVASMKTTSGRSARSCAAPVRGRRRRRAARAEPRALRREPAVPWLPRLHDLRRMTVTEVAIALALHKLGLLRDASTSTADFRRS